ncbi:carbamate kinase [Candidatus Enterococcus ferrettii]|uniref:Carbamate kinase n=1 Tax=Candidatus Enterococcus ferrettii TaxID=2815324 RepID=A0ABV0EX85_9ENTE|nr:carbamate kinase [Enterococcus sp. 665A]
MQQKKRIVVALGGNAILSNDASAKAQQQALKQTAQHLIKLINAETQVIISHGNGPQVGNLLLQQQAADSKENPAMPLDTCVAMTQGSIGFWLQNALEKEIQNANLEQEVATIITQVIVDGNDEAFKNPSKPIGPFLTHEQAQALEQATGAVYKEDAGRGWRKVVPSPKPISIKEKYSINTLVNNNVLTICAGGGGIPVEQHSGQGVEAVIDKDFASEKLAELLDADLLVILTGVEKIALNFGKEDEQWLDQVTVSELEQYIEEKHFAPGSMLPKVEAAIQYVKAKPKCKAIITSLEMLGDIDKGTVGTTVIS